MGGAVMIFSLKHNADLGKLWIITFILILFSFGGGMAFAAGNDDKTSDETSEVRSGNSIGWQEYNGRPIGVLTGTLLEDAAKTYFPQSEHLYFNSYPDLNAALLSGKIDAYIGDEPNLKTIHREQPEIDYIHDRITNQEYSFAFKKDDPHSEALCSELNDFLKKCREDGTMEELDDIWMGIEEDRKTVDMSGLTGRNGTIRVVTTSTDMPWSYIKDGKNVGYDIDLVVRFCRDRGYALTLGDVDFSGRIPAIESGKYDFTTDMNVTPERKEAVLFSDPTSYGGLVLAVPSSAIGEDPGDEEDSSVPGKGVYGSLSELKGKRIGVQTGSYFDELAKESIGQVELSYFTTLADMIVALKTDKIDAFIVEEPNILDVMKEDKKLTYIQEYLEEMRYGAVFPKNNEGEKLKQEFDSYLEKIRSDGTLDRMKDIWFSDDESIKLMEDPALLPAAKGTLRLASELTYPPFEYLKNGKPAGFDIDLAARFCREKGYGLDIENMDFSGVLPAVQTGKCDFAVSALTITKERAESVNFSEAYYDSRTIAVVLRNETVEDNSILSKIKASFEKTFIREGRYKLFLQGILTTITITVLSIIFGTLLGFVSYMLCRKGGAASNAIAGFFVWMIQGLPVVVLLMILYYVIFASSSIDGATVSVLAFTLVFGVAVFGMLKMGVGAVDSGQTEAAYALGFSDMRTFFRIILPQAIPHFLPSYKAEVISLIKATAVVGYIAVQDLTKMGDIVRGRTYEAFFPLIAVAIIYFILGGILTFIVSKIEININPKKRKEADILKGVKTDD